MKIPQSVSSAAPLLAFPESGKTLNFTFVTILHSNYILHRLYSLSSSKYIIQEIWRPLVTSKQDLHGSYIYIYIYVIVIINEDRNKVLGNKKLSSTKSPKPTIYISLQLTCFRSIDLISNPETSVQPQLFYKPWYPCHGAALFRHRLQWYPTFHLKNILF